MCIQQLEMALNAIQSIIHSMLPGRSFAHARNLMHFCSDFIFKKWQLFARKDPLVGFCDVRVI